MHVADFSDALHAHLRMQLSNGAGSWKAAVGSKPGPTLHCGASSHCSLLHPHSCRLRLALSVSSDAVMSDTCAVLAYTFLVTTSKATRGSQYYLPWDAR